MSLTVMLRTATVCMSTLLFFSCDKDVSDVGGDILTGTDISIKEFNTTNISSENISLNTIQSNNLLLDGFFLGTKKNDASGDINYGILLRAEATNSANALAELNATPGTVFKVQSAKLVVPYALDIISSNTQTGENTFNIKDIENNGEALEVDVFRNDYRLQIISPDNNIPQIYFSDASDNTNNFRSLIEKDENSIFGSANNIPISENFTLRVVNENGDALNAETLSDDFENAEKVFQVNLKNDFLGPELVESDGTIKDINKIIDGQDFLNNFRGIFIRPSATNNNLVKVIDDSVELIVPKIEVTFELSGAVNQTVNVVFNLNRQVINTTEFLPTTEFTTAFETSETITLKGGAAVSEIQLFSDESKLDSLYNENILVNQAVLRFTVDQDSPLFSEDELPASLFINQSENGAVLNDYLAATNNIDTHLIPLNKEKFTYDIIVTNHIANILNQTTIEAARVANRKLALGLSDNNTNRNSLMLKSQNKRVNTGNLQSDKEVPLFGTNAAAGKRPQLIIKFTSTK